MHKITRTIILLAYTVLMAMSTACVNDDLHWKDEISALRKELTLQAQLINALNENLYVSDVIDRIDSYTVTFSNGQTMTFEKAKTPIITIGDNGNWYINGEDTGRPSTGRDGIDGIDGKDGKDGKDGTNGIDGKDGADGKDGTNGIDGKDGKDGIDGKDGKDGTNGIDGKDGKDGIDGKDGTNGIDGKDGKDGIDGKDGKDGTNGIDGKDGKDGIDGKDGKDGIDGKDGKDGKDGIDGKDGTNGIDGKDGKDGIDGKDGTNGIDGKDGKDGIDGKDGKDGVDGKDGKDGIDGKDGKDGIDGKDGKDGKDAPYVVKIVDDGTTVNFYFSDGTQIDVVKQKLEVAKDPLTITCWGDSFTAGAGGKSEEHIDEILEVFKARGFSVDKNWRQGTYAQYLNKMLGNAYNVRACGVGGENNAEIAARMGANLAKIREDFVLPADGTDVQVSDWQNGFDSAWGYTIKPLLQGAGASVNPCYVEGIECTLKWIGLNYLDKTGVYRLSRTRPGDRDVTIPAGTPIIMFGSKGYRDTYITVLWTHQGGGYSDDEALARQLRKMTQSLPNQNYVIVGLHTGDYNRRKAQEQVLESEFGDRFLNLRRYMSSNALADYNIEPDETDLEYMSRGACPPALLTDGSHLCAGGYAIVAYKLYERFHQLGYIP